MKTLFLHLSLFLSLTLSAQGLQFVYESYAEGGNAAKTVLFLNADFVKIDGMPSFKGATVIFNREKETIYLVNYAEKTILTMGKAEMEQTQTILKEMLVMFEAQSTNFTPEQLPAARQMMRENGYAIPASKIVFKKDGTASVNDWKGTNYSGTVGTIKAMNLISILPEKLELEAKEMEILNAMKPYLAVLIDAIPTSTGNAQIFMLDTQYEGLPLQTTDFMNGKATTTITLKSFEKKELDKAIFQVPEGFKKEYLELGY